jgi:hypothetical protein
MTEQQVERRIAELNEDIEDALANGRQGEAEELYMEVEKLCYENY